MSKMLSNAEEIARHITLEGQPREIVSTMMTAAHQMKREDAYAAMVGLLVGIAEGETYMEASITADVEGLRDDFSADHLNRACEHLVEAFTKVVEKRVAARARR